MKDQARTYVKSLILSQLLLEANDELEGTPFYDTRLSVDVKRLEKTLIKQIDKQFMNIYNADTALIHNIMFRIEGLVKKLSSCQIDDLTMSMLDKVTKISKQSEDGNSRYRRRHPMQRQRLVVVGGCNAT